MSGDPDLVTGSRVRWIGTLVLLLAVVLAAGCARAEPRPPEPETSGVADLKAVPYDPATMGAGAEVSVEGERTVLITFTTGPCSTPEAASRFPEALNVAYTPDQIILISDTRLECDNDGYGVDRAARVELEEAIGDRNVLLCRLADPTLCFDENAP